MAAARWVGDVSEHAPGIDVIDPGSFMWLESSRQTYRQQDRRGEQKRAGVSAWTYLLWRSRATSHL